MIVLEIDIEFLTHGCSKLLSIVLIRVLIMKTVESRIYNISTSGERWTRIIIMLQYYYYCTCCRKHFANQIVFLPNSLLLIFSLFLYVITIDFILLNLFLYVLLILPFVPLSLYLGTILYIAP
jgi:hypothetical protein